MKQKIKSNESDKKFDENQEDILDHLNTDNIIKRVSVDFPNDVVKGLDRLAKKRGVTRQSLIKIWIYEKIREESA